jgi:MFS family permease
MALFFGVSQGVLSVYIPNLFPVNIRGTATGFCFNTGRLVTAVAVLFVGVLVSALGGYGNSLFIFSLVFVIGFVTTLVSKNDKQKDGKKKKTPTRKVLNQGI